MFKSNGLVPEEAYNKLLARVKELEKQVKELEEVVNMLRNHARRI